MKRAISRKFYKKIASMYWCEYVTRKYHYSIDMWGDILRTEKGINPHNPRAVVDVFRWNAKSDTWKYVEG